MLQCCILDLTDRAGQKDKALIRYYFANICLTSSSFSPLLFLLLFSLFIADHQLLHTKMSPLISLGYAPCYHDAGVIIRVMYLAEYFHKAVCMVCSPSC